MRKPTGLVSRVWGERTMVLDNKIILKHIVREIRKQPQHIRELATILCTIAVVAVVVLVWYRSFQKDIYALLNPDQQIEAPDKFFAQESKSLFGSILQVLDEGKAQISDLFNQDGETNVINQTDSDSKNVPHPLPVSQPGDY